MAAKKQKLELTEFDSLACGAEDTDLCHKHVSVLVDKNETSFHRRAGFVDGNFHDLNLANR